MWGVSKEHIDDYGLPHDDVRSLVNSIIYMEKNLPMEFYSTEHERMNLVFFAKEFINADKQPKLSDIQMFTGPSPLFFAPNEDEEDDDKPSEV